jgi:hypothetical protein
MRQWNRVAVLAAPLSCSAAAEQSGIRLSGSSQPGCWSVDEIVRDVTAGIAGDRERALALHRFGMAHFIHFDGPSRTAASTSPTP